MLILVISLPIYLVVATFLFLLGRKKYSARHTWWLSLIHAITIWITFIFEIMWIRSIRAKYNKRIPKVINSLNKSNLKYHLVYGPLLFAYRDGTFSDNDMDICMYYDDYNYEANEILKNLGFVLKEEWYLDGVLKEQTYINKIFKVDMDIFFIGKGEEFAPVFDEKNNRYSRRENTYKYDLADFTVDEITVKAPSNIEEYLEWVYGDWQKPDPNFHWLYGSSNKPSILVENANIEYKKY